MGGSEDETTIASVGIAVSHITRYLSVISLYRLSLNVWGGETPVKKLQCSLSAALHVISPAGAFLSAPYGEPIFSFLNITGLYIYSSSLLDGRHGKKGLREVKLLAAAAIFAVATTVRSNGILSGFLFAYDACFQLWQVISQGITLDRLVHLAVIIVAGSVVLLGIAVPQFTAYKAYCMSSEVASRPWCTWLLPSIYSWVQGQYW